MRYVVIGYTLTYGTLIAYIVSLMARLRSAEKKVGEQA